MGAKTHLERGQNMTRLLGRDNVRKPKMQKVELLATILIILPAREKNKSGIILKPLICVKVKFHLVIFKSYTK